MPITSSIFLVEPGCYWGSEPEEEQREKVREKQELWFYIYEELTPHISTFKNFPPAAWHWVWNPSSVLLYYKHVKALRNLVEQNLVLFIFNAEFGDSDSEESACSAGDPGSIPASGRSPGGRKGNPLQHSCLKSILAWRLPWTEKPGGLQSIRLQFDMTEQLTL